MEVIFTNFWTWAGTVILTGAVFGGIASVIKAIKGPGHKVQITAYKDHQPTKIVEIDEATAEDVRKAVECAERGNEA